MRNVLQACICICIALLSFNKAIVVQKVFVPEKHYLLLTCDGQSEVEWRHGDTQIIKMNSTKYLLLSEGKMVITNLEIEDTGLYYCNGQLAAAVSVFTCMQHEDNRQEKTVLGYKLEVSEGGTLYLRCKFPKQRWAFKATLDSKRKFISTRFKNGTVIKEREDPDCRFIHTSDHLQILSLQIDDSGIYYCNGNVVAAITVTRTEAQQTTLPTLTAEATESENGITQISGNAMLVSLLALSVLAVVIMVLVSVIVCLKVYSKKKAKALKPEQTELQPQKLPAHEPLTCHREEEHIHYASLGRQNWKNRGWTHEKRQQVIYSTVLLTPKHTPTHKVNTLKM